MAEAAGDRGDRELVAAGLAIAVGKTAAGG